MVSEEKSESFVPLCDIFFFWLLSRLFLYLWFFCINSLTMVCLSILFWHLCCLFFSELPKFMFWYLTYIFSVKHATTTLHLGMLDSTQHYAQEPLKQWNHKQIQIYDKCGTKQSIKKILVYFVDLKHEIRAGSYSISAENLCIGFIKIFVALMCMCPWMTRKLLAVLISRLQILFNE